MKAQQFLKLAIAMSLPLAIAINLPSVAEAIPVQTKPSSTPSPNPTEGKPMNKTDPSVQTKPSSTE